ncbi:MAG: PAS domain S-box protein [Desulfarculaceae bacterium]|nr:PAS domain S-box protein [Desulfarculaceae bacterium]
MTRLMWLGPAQPGREELLEALSGSLPGLEPSLEPELEAGLERLGSEPTAWPVVVADLRGAGWGAGGVLPRIRQISPDIEVLLLLRASPAWSGEELAGQGEPMMLCDPISPAGLVSAVGKLLELARLRRRLGQLKQSQAGRLGLARHNAETALNLLYRMGGVGIVALRRDGLVALYDSEVRRLTGSVPGERTQVGDWLAGILADSSQVDKVLAALEQAWARGAARGEISLSLATPAGAGRRLAMRILVMVGDQGDPRQLVMLLYDPSERSAILEYERLLASPELGAYAYYPELGFARFNLAALALLNQSFGLELGPGEVLGRHPAELPLPPEAAKAWQGLLDLAAAGRNLSDPPPLGLAGQRLFGHALLAPVEREAEGPGVTAWVRPPRPEPQEGPTARGGSLAGYALDALPNALMLLEAVRGEDGAVLDFQAPWVNPAAWRLLGRVDFFSPGLGLAELFVDGAARERIFREAASVAELGGPAEIEIGVRLPRASSESRLVNFWIGRVGRGVALRMADVTVQREAERRQRQYAHIFHHMEEAIIVTDLAGIIIDWNPASEKMFGYRKDEVLGKDTRMLMPEARSRELARHGAKVVRDGDVWKGEYEFQRRDGSRGMGSSVMALLKDDGGRAYGTVGLARDVTQRRRLQDNLTVKSRELQEKNTALNTLLRHAEEERLRACQAVASDVGKRITQRIHQLLDHADSAELVREMAGLLLTDLGQRPASDKVDPSDPILRLTEKEMEVARLIRAGKTSEQIAAMLGKSPDTVRLQRISIRKKLGLKGRDKNLVNYLNRVDLI